MSFFQRLYDVLPFYGWLAGAVALGAIVLLFGYERVARRREDRRAEEAADAEWEAEQAAARAQKLPTALSIPDVVPKQEPVAPVSDAVIQSIARRAARPRPAPSPKRAKRLNRHKVGKSRRKK